MLSNPSSVNVPWCTLLYHFTLSEARWFYSSREECCHSKGWPNNLPLHPLNPLSVNAPWCTLLYHFTLFNARWFYPLNGLNVFFQSKVLFHEEKWTDVISHKTYESGFTWTGELWTPNGLGLALNLWSTREEWVVSVMTIGDFDPIDLAIFPDFLGRFNFEEVYKLHSFKITNYIYTGCWLRYCGWFWTMWSTGQSHNFASYSQKMAKIGCFDLINQKYWIALSVLNCSS